jgi:hypothetical protein
MSACWGLWGDGDVRRDEDEDEDEDEKEEQEWIGFVLFWILFAKTI